MRAVDVSKHSVKEGLVILWVELVDRLVVRGCVSLLVLGFGRCGAGGAILIPQKASCIPS